MITDLVKVEQNEVVPLRLFYNVLVQRTLYTVCNVHKEDAPVMCSYIPINCCALSCSCSEATAMSGFRHLHTSLE